MDLTGSENNSTKFRFTFTYSLVYDRAVLLNPKRVY